MKLKSILIEFIVLSMLPFIIDCESDELPSYEPSRSSPEPNEDPLTLPNEPSSSPDPREDSLIPPNELSVIRLNDTSVVLRWEFPENSQEHLLYFKVQYRPTRKNSVWRTDPPEISSVTRAYQINGLRPGNYLFIVIAVYDNQDSASSKSCRYKLKANSKIPPADMPETKAPAIFWHEAETDYFRFKWHYEPKSSDNEDFGFLVYYRSTHIVSDFTIYNTMDTNVEIAELEPDTPYEAKVVAYNENGTSEFSDTITIRTKPARNEQTSSNPKVPTISSDILQTSTASLSQSTTKRPSTPLVPSTEVTTNNPTTPQITNRGQTTSKPLIKPTLLTDLTSSTETVIAFFKPIFSEQSDAMLIAEYLLLVLIPILFITFGLIFLIRPYRNKKDPRTASSTNDAQFDLEINGYFKNSFPGVEYPSVPIGVHTGFVNNHPHINDFA